MQVFYFSSTGNSLYVAKRIAEAFNGALEYIPKFRGDIQEEDVLVIVSPIYSFGLPVHTFAFIQGLKVSAPVYVVLTYGGMVLGADRLTYDLCRETGLDIRAVFTIKMVENFTLQFTVPGFFSKATLKAAPRRVDRIIAKIRQHEQFEPKATRCRRNTYETNKASWYKIANDFTVTADCVRCGKCVALCPSGNIRLTDQGVAFLTHCVACLGCYHRCPQKAIRYQGRKKKDRYFCPLISESEMAQ